jgi:Uncharacterized conserved protein (DUF2358)
MVRITTVSVAWMVIVAVVVVVMVLTIPHPQQQPLSSFPTTATAFHQQQQYRVVHKHRHPVTRSTPTVVIRPIVQRSVRLHALLQEPDQREKKQELIKNDSSKKDDDEFTLRIGRALDTLRKEYPHLLTQSPDYALYDDEINLCVDLPTSPWKALTYNSISGISRYKMVWDMMHGLMKLLYNVDQSYMSSIKLCHDRVRGNVIRVQWHAVLFPRWLHPSSSAIDGNTCATASHSTAATVPPPSWKCHHMDGISVYELDWKTGKIVQHRIEQLVYTNNVQPVMVLEEVLMRHPATVIAGGSGVPVQIRSSAANTVEEDTVAGHLKNTIVEFRCANSMLFHPFRPSSLFAAEAERPSPPKSSTEPPSIAATTSSGKGTNIGTSDLTNDMVTSMSSSFHDPSIAVDTTALDAKNKSRKKFGLKPLTPTEFIQLQNDVVQLATIQQEKAIEAAKINQAKQEELRKQGSSNGPSNNLFNKVFGSVLKNLDTCESNFDCIRPQVCCDYIFAKKCCSSGSPVISNNSLQYARIPVYAGDGNKNDPQQRRY